MYIENILGRGGWRRKRPRLGARAISQRDRCAKMNINQSINVFAAILESPELTRTHALAWIFAEPKARPSILEFLESTVVGK